jgi:hypothetical protein
METAHKKGEAHPVESGPGSGHPRVDKEVLKHLNAASHEIGYNRLLDLSAVDALPADAEIGIVPAMVHEHAAGKPVEPHIRAMVYLLSESESEPKLFGFLDITMAHWRVLKRCQAQLAAENEIDSMAREKLKPENN